eukprot:TRINITY_DN50316_c0_g1_i1.p1 TRINITY_DN50316_c0_g1~~TRINITY_DN50316_c0_g1_i1.p1  ORF type:complete len:408 (+),score=134.03 TRINITY_DN50316_c0_g1_i1:60-1283(+)
MASGLAGKVRRVTESDDFDLSGYDQAKCAELVKAAFSEPLPLREMIRLSFTVGGGKLVRQKYSDDLPKIFMNALTAGGYQEDAGATVEVGSAGKFKYHHDTNKNLKFVHVFPKLGGEVPDASGGGYEEAEEEEAPSTPEDLLFRSDEKEFLRLVQTHLTTYAQKKKLLELLKQRISALEAIEQKMTRMERLEASEEALFNDVGSEELKEKCKVLTSELQTMIDAGQLTAAEKADFLEQLDGKLALLGEEIKKAEADGKAKKVQALTQQRDTMQKTRTAAKEADPVSLPALKNGAQIRELRVKLADLARIEKASKGNYTMDELRRLGERPEIEEAVQELESRARGWLESDEVFQQRLEANLRAGPAKKSTGGGRGSGGGGYTAVTGGARAPKAKAGGPSTRNGFAALG